MDFQVHFPLCDQSHQLSTSVSSPEEAVSFLDQIDKIPNRSISFLDEVISGFIILKGTADSAGESPASVANATTISVDLSIQSSEYTKTARERLQLNYFNIQNDTDLIFRGLINEKVVLIWKFDIPVNYPKKKIPSPKIIINLVANVNRMGTTVASAHTEQNESTKQDSRNILEGITSKTFSTDVVDPYLPLYMVDPNKPLGGGTSTTNGHNSSQPQPLVLRAKFSLPVYPILTMRLKSAKMAGQADNNSVLATLELSSSKDIFKLNQLSVLVTKIEIQLKDGEVQNLFQDSLLEKLEFKDKNDNINLTYKLVMYSGMDQDSAKPLNIKIVAIPRRLNAKNELVNLTNQIEMKWMTTVDFENIQSQGAKKKKKLPQSQQPSRNVSNVNLGTNRKSELKFSLTKQIAASAASAASAAASSSSGTLSGLKFTVFGQNRVKLGQTFHLNLQIINNSNKSHKLLILFNNDAYLNDNMMEKKFPKLPSSIQSKSRSTVSLNSVGKDAGSMIQSQLSLIRSYSLSKLKTSGIICMNNELKLDALDPQSLLDTGFDLMAIQKGIYHLEGVKIVDLNTGESIETGKLLQIVVH